MVIGLLQDSLSGPTVPLGLYGIAKTVIGYLASSGGSWFCFLILGSLLTDPSC
jgi:hypothetical protein